MNGVKIGKGGKNGELKNSKIDEERRCQKEEKLCKSIIKDIARCGREKQAILAEVEEEEQDVRCIDDVTGTQCAKFANKI